MTDTAVHVPLRPARVPRQRWGWRLSWLLLTIYFLAPPRATVDASLDNSNFASYSYFLTHHYQWGADVTPMPGPLGFLIYGNIYSGELFGARYVGDFLLKGLFTLLLLRLFSRAGPGILRWIWLLGVVAVLPQVDDLLQDFSLLVATLVILGEMGPRPGRWPMLGAVLLGIVTLIKGNHPTTAFLCLAAVWLLGAWTRHWGAVIRLTTAYAITVVACWMIAGQDPAHIPAFLYATLQLSLGYNAAMGLAAPHFLLVSGLGLVAMVAAVFAWAGYAGPRQARFFVAVLVVAGFTFIKWKHGFVRADGHVYIFFTATVALTLTLALIARSAIFAPPAPMGTWTRRCGLAVMTLAAGWGLLGAAEFNAPLAGLFFADIPARLQRNARYLVRPVHFREPLDRQLELARRAADVPQIRAEVGQDIVDFFGNEEGLLILNRLNYRPRPMGGGTFNVFNAWVQDRNEAFVRDPHRAPWWQVMKLDTIDRRLPAADDGTTLRAILELYSLVLIQRDYLLLQRRPEPVAIAAPRLVSRRVVTPGETLVPPPVNDDEMLLMTVEAPLSFAGRVRSFFYRAPELRARIASRFRPHGETFVLKPSMLQRPVILSPLLADNGDVLTLLGHQPGNAVRSIALDPQPGFATDELAISFFVAPRPPKPAVDVADLLTYRRFPLYNRPPLELVTQETGIRELFEEPITIVHAPGSITWDLQPTDREVTFSYGLMPQAYLDGGTTDGVGFNVEVIWPPRDGRILVRKLLRPVAEPADRGMHRLHVYLPPFEPGARLRIRTDTGPGTDGAYDQAYVTHLQIKSGPLVAAQFNGLGLVPADGKLPHLAVASIGERPVFLVHAPGELALNIPAGVREFACEIGLLPSAYLNGGHTDGVEYTIELVRPNGEHQELLRRTLTPVTRPADQGPQPLSLPLPAAPTGSRLIIRTDPGPAHDVGWDQSYVVNARFN